MGTENYIPQLEKLEMIEAILPYYVYEMIVSLFHCLFAAFEEAGVAWPHYAGDHFMYLHPHFH